MPPRWERGLYEAVGLCFSALHIAMLPLVVIGLDGPAWWAWGNSIYFASWASPTPVWPNQVSPLRRLHRWVGETLMGSPGRICVTVATVYFAAYGTAALLQLLR